MFTSCYAHKYESHIRSFPACPNGTQTGEENLQSDCKVIGHLIFLPGLRLIIDLRNDYSKFSFAAVDVVPVRIDPRTHTEIDSSNYYVEIEILPSESGFAFYPERVLLLIEIIK